MRYRLAVERLLNRDFGPDLERIGAIEHGKEYEKDAIWKYKRLKKVEPYRVSFVIGDDERLGCSPDSLVTGDDRHGVEIKCPQPPRLAAIILDGLDDKYRVQFLGQFYVAQLHRNDLFVYHPDMPSFFKRWEREEVETDIGKLASAVGNFLADLEADVEKLQATGFFSRHEQPQTALDQMVASMEGELVRASTIAGVDAWWAEHAANLGYLDAEQRERLMGIAALKRETMAGSTP